MKLKRVFKIMLFVMASALLFASCNGTDPTETPTSTKEFATTETVKQNEEEKKPVSEPWIMKKEKGISVREITIDIAGNGEIIEIIQLSDFHLNHVNAKDREENNPLTMASANDPKLWLSGAASLPTFKSCLEWAKNADQIVLTGDLMSYLSYGNLELLKRNVWDKYDNLMAVMGNHDPLRCWNGKTDESATLQERLAIMQGNWNNDIYYSSKVIDERVMLIQMDNAARYDYGNPGFWESQIEPFQRDLALAREKGYAVLLFYHVPLATGNPVNILTNPIGTRGSVANYYSSNLVGSTTHTNAASKQIYQMITNNADIIKGCFAGHMHGDYYTEIKAKTASGEDAVIPQYILTASAYDNGHAIRIKLS